MGQCGCEKQNTTGTTSLKWKKYWLDFWMVLSRVFSYEQYSCGQDLAFVFGNSCVSKQWVFPELEIHWLLQNLCAKKHCTGISRYHQIHFCWNSRWIRIWRISIDKLRSWADVRDSSWMNRSLLKIYLHSLI